MHKLIVSFTVAVLIVSSILAIPGQTAYAQVSFPAEINKSFTPISIPAGGTSRLSVTIFNPNSFPLTNASWSDNLVGVQSGLVIASSPGVSNSCNGTVSATAGGITLSLSGGTVPAQVGANPGSCTVSVNVTSTSTGNKINTIPAGELTSTGGGVNVTNTTPASATLNVAGSPTPSVSKSLSPSTIWAGQISQLSIVITNNEAGRSLTQATLTDNLPANVALANPPATNLTGCGGSASVTAVSGGTAVTLNNGSIAPNASCIITVNVTSNTQGTYTNRIPANALGTQQGVTNTSPATARLNVRAIGVAKRFTPTTVSAGGTTTLIITLQNPTGTPYTGVSLTDNLPTPLTVNGTVTTDCGGAITTTSTSISLSGGTIPAGSPTSPGTCTISVPVSAPVGTASGRLRNTIPPGGLTTAQGVGNLVPVNADVTVAGSSVGGTKSFSPSTITAGSNSRLRIDFFAPGDTNLTNFSLTDNLPAGVTVSNSSPSVITGCGPTPPLILTASTGATSINLSGGLITAGQRCRIDVFVTSNTSGTHTNTISPGNISNSENRVPTGDITSNLTVSGGATLAIDLVKGFDPLTVFGGSSSTMSLQLINPGNVELTDIVFTDSMPGGMILANPVNFNVGTCGGVLDGSPGANSFSFRGGSLPPQGTCVLTLSATMTVNGNLTNTIPAGAVSTAQGVTNATPVEATLTNLPGASVGKFFSPNPISAGSFSLLTITIQNTGNIPLTGMGLSDSLPAGLEIAGGSAPAPVNNCGGTFTAVAGTQLVQLTNGSLGGNAACTIVVSVTGSVLGDYQNTIPQGALITDPSVNATNREPATDTLVITDGTGAGGNPAGGGRAARPDDDLDGIIPVTGGFIIPVTGAGFAPGSVTKLDTSSRPAYESTALRIQIPVIKVNTSIVGVESREGNVDLSWLQDEVGWLNGTAYPTWKGNSVLLAHVVGADGKPGVFFNLKALGVGEYIFVNTLGYRYTYQVVANRYDPRNDGTFIKHEEKSYLTLITCDTYDEKTGAYLRYVLVRAELVDVREIKN